MANPTQGNIEVSTPPSAPSSGLSAVGAAAVAVGVVTGAASALNSVVSGLLGITASGVTLPLTNALNNYASYNYIFTLIVLDTDSYNFPDRTYIKGRSKIPIILKSGSGNPSNRIMTDVGRNEFFLEDLNIESTIGFKLGLGNTNAVDISFNIKEPYSMGGFMMALQEAAYRANYDNFRQAVYCLIVEFKGETEAGTYSTIPKTTRFLPFKFRDINMEVTEGGATYKCTAMPASEDAFLHSKVEAPTTLQIAGKTVQEMLQTGNQSLQSVWNQRLREQAKAAGIPVADQIVIIFPATQATASTPATAPDKIIETVKPASSSTSAENVGTINSVLGVSLSDTNQTLVQTANVNPIGIADMGYSATREGTTVSPPLSVIVADNPAVGESDPSKKNKDPKLTSYRFKAGANMVDIINEVILTSTYATENLKKDPKATGMRSWWAIQPQVYHVDDKSTATKTGRKPEITVYRVMEYDVHSTNHSLPGAGSSSFQTLLKQCVKVYNYLYTGKNTEIIKFNILFENAWTTIMQNDYYRNSGDVKRADVNNSSDGKQLVPDSQDGGAPKKSIFSPIAEYIGRHSHNDYKGGGGQETAEHRAARTFHDAVTYGNEMAMCEMEIMGDPYWLTGNLMGNYNASATEYQNLSSDGSVNNVNGEVDVAITFRTPADIVDATGLYSMTGAKPLQMFTGIWKVVTVKHKFSNGQFTQTLSLTRRPMGPNDYVDTVFSTKNTVERPTPDTAQDNSQNQ